MEFKFRHEYGRGKCNDNIIKKNKKVYLKKTTKQITL